MSDEENDRHGYAQPTLAQYQALTARLAEAERDAAHWHSEFRRIDEEWSARAPEMANETAMALRMHEVQYERANRMERERDGFRNELLGAELALTGMWEWSEGLAELLFGAQVSPSDHDEWSPQSLILEKIRVLLSNQEALIDSARRANARALAAEDELAERWPYDPAADSDLHRDGDISDRMTADKDETR